MQKCLACFAQAVQTKCFERVLFAVTTVLIFTALYLAFIYVPNERTMGPVQRIFYFHVSSAIACYLCVAIAFVSSVLLLWRKNVSAEPWQVAAIEVASMFCTMTLLSGMVWGNAAWNTPFRMEPRLVSFLLFWLVLVSIVLLRAFSRTERTAQLSSVLVIVATATIPLIVWSVKLLPQTVQLHPQVLGNRGLEFPGFMYAFLVAVFSFLSFACLLVLVRGKLEALDIELHRRQLELL